MDNDFYDLGEPRGYNVTTSTMRNEEEPHCSSTSWLWIVLLVIAIFAIIGLIVWIVLLYRHRDSKDKNVGFVDPNILVNSNTSISGTWKSTTNTDDFVELWATLNPPKIKSDGTVDTTRFKVVTSAAGATTVGPLDGLTPGLKYYATMIVRNKNSSNYQVYTQIVYMEFATPLPAPASGTVPFSGPFSIQDILQVGKIQLEPDLKSVIFTQTPVDTTSLWQMDPTSASMIQNNADPTICLYASSTGTLVPDLCISPVTNTLPNGKWSYNQSPLTNSWCIASTVGSTTAPLCMALTQISNGTATINVNNTTTSGNGFANVFETPK